MPICVTTLGSETVFSMRPYSSGRPLYSSSSGKIVDALTVFVGNASGARAHVADRGRDVGAVGGDERRADAVVRLRALDVRLHNSDAGGLTVLDRRLDAVDRRFLDRELSNSGAIGRAYRAGQERSG